MRIFFYLIGFIVVLLATAFACLNAQTVSVNYYVGQLYLPLCFVLAMAVLFGALFAYLASLFPLFRAKYQINSLKKQLQRLKSDGSTG